MILAYVFRHLNDIKKVHLGSEKGETFHIKQHQNIINEQGFSEDFQRLFLNVRIRVLKS